MRKVSCKIKELLIFIYTHMLYYKREKILLKYSQRQNLRQKANIFHSMVYFIIYAWYVKALFFSSLCFCFSFLKCEPFSLSQFFIAQQALNIDEKSFPKMSNNKKIFFSGNSQFFVSYSRKNKKNRYLWKKNIFCKVIFHKIIIIIIICRCIIRWHSKTDIPNNAAVSIALYNFSLLQWHIKLKAF